MTFYWIFLKNGPFLASFYIFSCFQYSGQYIKSKYYQRLESNRGPLLFEATAQPWSSLLEGGEQPDPVGPDLAKFATLAKI